MRGARHGRSLALGGENILTPEYLQSVPDAMVELYARVELDILSDMARRINGFDLFIPSARYQMQVLEEMGALRSDIVAQLSRLTGKSQKELAAIMREAGIKSLAEDEKIYRAAGMTLSPLAASPAVKKALAAGMKKTGGLFTNLTKTTANTATKQFERALDEAYMRVTSGAFSPQEAGRLAVKDLSRDGVKAIEYPSGHTDTIEVAVRRAVVTGVNQTCGEMQEMRARELGCDLMELTAHAGARPSHAVWQGQIVSLSGRPGYLSKDDIGYGTGAGFKGWNCSHDWRPYFEGTPRAFSKEQLDSYQARNYEYNGQKMTESEAQQKQREIERNIRRWKRENVAMKAAGQDAAESAAKLARWQNTQKDFLNQTGLKRQAERESVAGWGRSQAASARSDARKGALTNAAGQRIIKSKKTTPAGEPDAITQVVSAKGGVSRNYYDRQGRWVKQVTNNNHGNPRQHPFGKNGEHTHDIVWKDGEIVDRPVRELTEQERKENADIL